MFHMYVTWMQMMETIVLLLWNVQFLFCYQKFVVVPIVNIAWTINNMSKPSTGKEKVIKLSWEKLLKIWDKCEKEIVAEMRREKMLKKLTQILGKKKLKQLWRKKKLLSWIEKSCWKIEYWERKSSGVERKNCWNMWA